MERDDPPSKKRPPASGGKAVGRQYERPRGGPARPVAELVPQIGRAAFRLGEIFRTYFDTPVINGSGDLVAQVVNRFGHSFRVIQTGRVQQYLLILMAVVVVVGAVLLLPGLGR